MHISELKGIAIVTLADASKVGTIDDILFDAQYQTVLGFRVKQGGIFSGTVGLLRSSISAIGKDAVTIASADALNDESRLADLAATVSLQTIQGTKVVTESGDFIGTIYDIEVDEEIRQVTAYILDASFIDRIRHPAPQFTPDHVVQIGSGGIMTVNSGVVEQLHPTK